jgi:hypothetical protein
MVAVAELGRGGASEEVSVAELLAVLLALFVVKLQHIAIGLSAYLPTCSTTQQPLSACRHL